MALTIADVNRDGSDDIVAGYTSAPGSILLNDGTGLVFRHTRFGERSGSVYGVAVADVNGDGHVDVAAARSSAPSTVHVSRSGGTSTSVSTSAKIVSPVPLFEPRPSDARTLLAGVWSGTATQRGQGSITFGIELLIENTGDRMTGRRLTHEGGIVYCTSSLVLEERTIEDQYVFRETFEAGFCQTGAIRLRRVSENDLQLELFPGTDSKPIATAALARKQ